RDWSSDVCSSDLWRSSSARLRPVRRDPEDLGGKGESGQDRRVELAAVADPAWVVTLLPLVLVGGGVQQVSERLGELRGRQPDPRNVALGDPSRIDCKP